LHIILHGVILYDVFYCDTVIQDTEPPKGTLWRVKVLRDYGALQTDRGEVDLKVGTSLYLPRSVCDTLIKQGIVEMVQ
jgi:hypothetical protein